MHGHSDPELRRKKVVVEKEVEEKEVEEKEKEVVQEDKEKDGQ